MLTRGHSVTQKQRLPVIGNLIRPRLILRRGSISCTNGRDHLNGEQADSVLLSELGAQQSRIGLLLAVRLRVLVCPSAQTLPALPTGPMCQKRHLSGRHRGHSPLARLAFEARGRH